MTDHLLSENVPRFTALSEALKDHGITVPDRPYGGDKPLSWLIRGDSNRAKLTGREYAFLPQSGSWGSWGVFLADNLSTLMMADATYLYRTTTVEQSVGTHGWLTYPSERATRLLEEIAKEKGWNTTSISGGVSAEQELFIRHLVYQGQNGIATVHLPLPIRDADAIFVSRGLHRDIGNSLPHDLAGKIIPY